MYAALGNKQIFLKKKKKTRNLNYSSCKVNKRNKTTTTKVIYIFQIDY